MGLAIPTLPFADSGSYGKEEAWMTPVHGEEPAEQVLT
jgi:hypothetical protein